MNRRDMLKHLPAIPLAVAGLGPTVTQAVQRASNLARPIAVSEEPYAERLEWAARAVRSFTAPSLPFPEEGQAATVAATQAVIQWERYAENVRSMASNYGVELADLLKAVGLDHLPI